MVIAAALLLFILSGWGGLPYTDEGSLLLIGHGMAHGRHLYTDYANEKPPALFLLSALFMRANPAVYLAEFRLAIALAAGLAAGFYAWMFARGGPNGQDSRFWRGALTGFGIALSFAITDSYRWSPNSFIAFAVLPVPLLILADRRPAHWFGAGILAGFLLLARFQNAPLVLAVFWCASRPAETGGKTGGGLRGTRLKAVTAGFAAICSLCGIYLLATGTIADFWRIVFMENATQVKWAYYVNGISNPYYYLPVGAAALYAFQAGLRLRVRSEMLTVCLVLLAAALLSALPRPDYMRFLTAACLAALCLAQLVPERPRGLRAVAAGCLGFMLLISGSRIVHGQMMQAEMYRRAELEAADYVASITAPGTRIAIFPNESYIHLLAKREPVSRRYFLFPWRSSPEMQQEVLDALEKQGYPPIIDTTALGKPNPPQLLSEFAPELIRLRDWKYRLDRTFRSGIQVWVRNDPARFRR